MLVVPAGGGEVGYLRFARTWEVPPPAARLPLLPPFCRRWVRESTTPDLPTITTYYLPT